jgi:hypothetical protein
LQRQRLQNIICLCLPPEMKSRFRFGISEYDNAPPAGLEKLAVPGLGGWHAFGKKWLSIGVELLVRTHGKAEVWHLKVRVKR